MSEFLDKEFKIEDSQRIWEGTTSNFDRARLCYRRHTIPTTYHDCSLQRSNLESSIFADHKFVSCDFSNSEVANTLFVDCLFRDCTFRQANFVDTKFMGCKIESTGGNKGNFERSSFYRAHFDKSNRNHTFLINQHLTGFGMRYSSWSQCIWYNNKLTDVSLEGATFRDCSIDFMDLSNCSCRGVAFHDCRIEEFHSTIEKIFATTGVESILENSEFILKAYGLSRSRPFKKMDDQLMRHIATLLTSHVETGRLFEATNILFLISQYSNKMCRGVALEHEAAVERTDADKSENPCLEDSICRTIQDVVACSQQSGIGITPDSIINTFRTLEHHGVYDSRIYHVLLSIVKAAILETSVHNGLNDVSRAMISFSVAEYASNVELSIFHLAVRFPDVSLEDGEELQGALSFVHGLLFLAGVPESKYEITSIANRSIDFDITLKVTGDLVELLAILAGSGYCVAKGRRIIVMLESVPNIIGKLSRSALQTIDELRRTLSLKGPPKADELLQRISQSQDTLTGLEQFLKTHTVEATMSKATVPTPSLRVGETSSHSILGSNGELLN